MNVIETVRCYQCGAEARLEVVDAGTPREGLQRRHAIGAAGWWEHSSLMRFCPACRRSAQMALGVDFDASSAGLKGMTMESRKRITEIEARQIAAGLVATLIRAAEDRLPDQILVPDREAVMRAMREIEREMLARVKIG